MGSFLKSNWKKLLGIAIAASAAVPVLAPFAIPLVGVGSMVFGSDFQHGAQVGTPLGTEAKKLADQVRAVLPKAGK